MLVDLILTNFDLTFDDSPDEFNGVRCSED